MESALRIPDANVSYAITAEFTEDVNRVHFYAFSVEAGHLLTFQLFVPAISSLENFAPVLLLIGPGLQSPDNLTASLLGSFGIELPSGTGAASYVYSGTANEKEFEPFTQVNLWIRQDVEVTLPIQGLYFLAVAVPEDWPYNSTSGHGKYVLAPGVLERFSILDFMSIPLDWIRWHSFWGDPIALYMIPTFGVLVAGTIATWLQLESRRPPFFEGKPRSLRPLFYLGVVGASLMIGSAVNQLLLVFGFSLASFGTGSLIVVALQTVGLMLGVLSFLMMRGVMKVRTEGSVVFAIAVASLMAFGSLIVGAGWILGPVLFWIMYSFGVASTHFSALRNSAPGRQ